MTNYRRNFARGGTYFFTVNLEDRRLSLLTEHIDQLRRAFEYVRTRHPFTIDAIVDVAKVTTPIKAGGKWNTFEITAKGSTFDVTLNGVKTVVGASDSKFPKGRVSLQYGQGVVKFRKVDIKPM